MLQPNEFFEKCKPEMDRITAQYERKQAALLPLLNFAQEQCGHISPEIEQGLAAYLGVPVVHVHEVVTFYTLLHRKPVGKGHCRIFGKAAGDQARRGYGGWEILAGQGGMSGRLRAGPDDAIERGFRGAFDPRKARRNPEKWGRFSFFREK